MTALGLGRAKTFFDRGYPRVAAGTWGRDGLDLAFQRRRIMKLALIVLSLLVVTGAVFAACAFC
jgi:hypothetical protein